MDVTASMEADLAPEVLFDVVADLATYPQWLEIVGRAEPVDAAPGDPGPAWSVDLRGQLGPLRRSKRLRMVRAQLERPDRVCFERREVDGRQHSPWVMAAEVAAAAGGGVRLVMRLHYGGSMWVPLLDRVLTDEIERSRPRLVAVAGGTA